MYDDDRGKRLVLLTRPMEIDQTAPMAQHSRGAVTGFTWADKGMGYSLVGPAAPEILIRLPTRSAGRPNWIVSAICPVSISSAVGTQNAPIRPP